MKNLSYYDYISKTNFIECLASFTKAVVPKLGDSIDSLNIFYAITDIIIPNIPVESLPQYLGYLNEHDPHSSVITITNFKRLIIMPEDISVMSLLQKLHNYSFSIKDSTLRVYYIFNFSLMVGEKNYYNFLLPSYLLTHNFIEWDNNA